MQSASLSIGLKKLHFSYSPGVPVAEPGAHDHYPQVCVWLCHPGGRAGLRGTAKPWMTHSSLPTQWLAQESLNLYNL